MFNESMRYNLKYGKPNATQDELEQAARDSQLLDFIESLDDGWETLVGDRGLKVRMDLYILLDFTTASLLTSAFSQWG
jgi:ABC-type multidrug transport system fused ATPase/permease subunit